MLLRTHDASGLAPALPLIGALRSHERRAAEACTAGSRIERPPKDCTRYNSRNWILRQRSGARRPSRTLGPLGCRPPAGQVTGAELSRPVPYCLPAPGVAEQNKRARTRKHSGSAQDPGQNRPSCTATPHQLRFRSHIRKTGDRMLANLNVRWLAAAAALCCGLWPGSGHGERLSQNAALVPVKMGISSLNKTDQATLWRRVDEYATVDALLEFCGRSSTCSGAHGRSWRPVSRSPRCARSRTCSAPRRRVRQGLGEGVPRPRKEEDACAKLQKPKFAEYTKILDAHIK